MKPTAIQKIMNLAVDGLERCDEPQWTILNKIIDECHKAHHLAEIEANNELVKGQTIDTCAIRHEIMAVQNGNISTGKAIENIMNICREAKEKPTDRDIEQVRMDLDCATGFMLGLSVNQKLDPAQRGFAGDIADMLKKNSAVLSEYSPKPQADAGLVELKGIIEETILKHGFVIHGESPSAIIDHLASALAADIYIYYHPAHSTADIAERFKAFQLWVCNEEAAEVHGSNTWNVVKTYRKVYWKLDEIIKKFSNEKGGV